MFSYILRNFLILQVRAAELTSPPTSSTPASTTAFDPTTSPIQPFGLPDFLKIPPGNIKTDLTAWANYLLTITSLLAGILAVYSLIYSGILFITSGGNQERSKRARANLIHTIIGIIIIVSTFFIVKLAISFGTGISNSLTL